MHVGACTIDNKCCEEQSAPLNKHQGHTCETPWTTCTTRWTCEHRNESPGVKLEGQERSVVSCNKIHTRSEVHMLAAPGCEENGRTVEQDQKSL